MKKIYLLLIYLQIGLAFGQSPGNVPSDIVAWFKADVGTTPATPSDGGSISQWDNQSGANNATETGTTGLILFEEEKHNFNPAIYFTNGDAGYFNLNLNAINNSDYNLIAVVERDEDQTQNYFLGTQQASSNNGLHFGYRDTDSVTLAQFANDIDTDVNGPSDPSFSQSLIRGQLDSSTGKVIQELRDGSFSENSHGNTAFLTGNHQGVLGRGFGGNGFQGYVSEVIVYSRTMLDSEVAKIFSYLALKYGMTLNSTDGITNGDYRASDGSAIIWDASADGGAYQNNVIGIGKDDDTDLDQQKSAEIITSVNLTLEKVGGFDNDLDYLIVGHNAAPLGFNASNVPAGILSKSQRTWKVHTKETPGAVSLSLTLGGDVPNTGNLSDYALLKHTGVGFSSATTIAPTSLSGGVLTFTGVNFVDGEFFTLGTSAVIAAPGDVSSGIVSWFKANDGTSTTIDGAVVDQWNNVVNENHATKMGATDNATFKENHHNYNPSVEFLNGNNGYFNTSLSDLDNSSYNVISIVERSSDKNDNYFIGSTGAATDEGFALGYSANSTLTLDQFTNKIDVSVSDFDAPAVSKSLVRSQLDKVTNGKIIQELRAGTYTTSANDMNTNALDLSTSQGVLGRGYDGNGFEGYVSEVIVYNQTLDNSQLSRIYSYLAIKYAMTLSTSDGITNGNYVDSNGDPIWDASTNTGFQNEIIGIGSDAASLLNQIRSTDPRSTAKLTIEKSSGFSNDKDFIIVGNNGVSETVTATGTHPDYTSRVGKVWKTQISGSPGAFSISFTLGDAIANTSDIEDYALLISTGTDFTSASVYKNEVTLVGNVLTFNNVVLTDEATFTLGVGANFKRPGGVTSGVVSWFRADAGTSTTTDGVGITQWDNQTGGVNAITQGDSSKVTYDEDEHNFNPAVYFDRGEDGYFNVDLDRIKNSDYNLISIVERDQNQNENYFLGTQQSSNNRGLHFGYRTNTSLTLAQYGNDIDVVVKEFDDPAFSRALIRGQLDSSTGKIIQEYRDGVFSENNHTNTSFLTGTAQGVLGRGQRQNGFNGYISEVLIYDRTLDNDELTQVYSYLGVKYGITLSTSDMITNGVYKASDGATIIWDGSSLPYSDYHSNVIAIGTDEQSLLEQKQSISSNSNAVLTVALGTSVAATNAANASSFDDNLDFLAIGEKATGTVFGVECGETILKVNRDWKVKNTGSVGTVTLQFDMTGILVPGDFDLIVDTDGDFATTGDQTKTASVPADLVGNNLTFSGLTLDDGAVFTLIRKIGYDVIFNGTQWLDEMGMVDVPDGTKRAIVGLTSTANASFECACLKVESGFDFTIPSTQYVNADELVLNGDLYLEGDAELIQTTVDTHLNSGTGEVYKILDDASDAIYEYNFFSSPVNTGGSFTIDGNLKFNTGATLGDNTDPSYTRSNDGSSNTLSTRWTHTMNNTLGFLEVNETTTMAPGVGVTMKGTGAANKYNFIGIPNNGTIEVPLTSGNYLLTGNPYPSTIDANAFNTANNSASGGATDGVIYLWDQPNATEHFDDSADPGDDSGGYATITNGVTVAAALRKDGVTPPPGATPLSDISTFIRPGQGFVVEGTATGNVVFTNAQRTTSYDGSRHFFKANKLTTLRSIIRLGFEYAMDDGKTYHRQLATVLEGSSMEREVGKDAYMFDYFSNDAYWELPGDQNRFIVTSVPNASDDLELPVGVVVTKSREVSFKLDNQPILDNEIYLYDKQENQITNIANNVYTTMVKEGDTQNRFSLVFADKTSLSSKNNELASNSIVRIEDGVVSVVLEKGLIEKVSLYTFSGEEINSKDVTTLTNHAELNIEGITSQLYILKVKTDGGDFNKKIFID